MKKEKVEKTCPQCRERFLGRTNKNFCSGTCRFKYWAIRHPRKLIEEDNNV